MLIYAGVLGEAAARPRYGGLRVRKGLGQSSPSLLFTFPRALKRGIMGKRPWGESGGAGPKRRYDLMTYFA